MIQSSPDWRTVSSIVRAAAMASAAILSCPAGKTVSSSAHASPHHGDALLDDARHADVAARADPDRSALATDAIVRRIVAPAAWVGEARREVDAHVATFEACAQRRGVEDVRHVQLRSTCRGDR